MFSHTLAEMSYYNPNSSIVEKISVILFDGTAEDPYLSNAYSVYLEKSSSRFNFLGVMNFRSKRKFWKLNRLSLMILEVIIF